MIAANPIDGTTGSGSETRASRSTSAPQPADRAKSTAGKTIQATISVTRGAPSRVELRQGEPPRCGKQARRRGHQSASQQGNSPRAEHGAAGDCERCERGDGGERVAALLE